MRSLDLLRITPIGDSLIDSISIDKLEDNKIHELYWVRSKEGTMSVSIDGKQRLSTHDATFRDPFDGVALLSDGADVILRSIDIQGIR